MISEENVKVLVEISMLEKMANIFKKEAKQKSDAVRRQTICVNGFDSEALESIKPVKKVSTELV